MISAPRRLTAEFLGSVGLSAVVVGSGIMAQRLSPNDVGLQLLENALATALGLGVLIAVFIGVSGAHFNPMVSLVDAALGGRPWRDAAAYIPVQVAGCVAGSILANLMFAEAAVAWSAQERLSPQTFLAEIVATAGLVFVIFALVRLGRVSAIPVAAGAYIGAAYFFTSSTSFANPAITVGRMVTDTFAGVAPASGIGFIAAQLLGGAVAWALVRWLYPVRE